jgi:hypothetical protein
MELRGQVRSQMEFGNEVLRTAGPAVGSNRFLCAAPARATHAHVLSAVAETTGKKQNEKDQQDESESTSADHGAAEIESASTEQ